jgi:hypothetical protein
MALSDFWAAVSGFFKNKSQVDQEQKTKIAIRRPAPNNITEDYQANKELTKGLFFNTYPGFKLGASLVYPMISIPIYFMGIPVVKPENDDPRIIEIIEDFQNKNYLLHKIIHKECHREGTVYPYPYYDSRSMRIRIELIQDHTVSRIVKDISTGDIIALYTDEELSIAVNDIDTAIVRRKRKFTKQRIDVTYIPMSGSLPDDMKSYSSRNPAGIIPVPFANDADSDEVRGHSVIERVISIIKSYHDLSLAELSTLAKFKAKMIQEVKDASTWLANNSITDISDYDVEATDLILNVVENGEKTTYAFPEGSASDHNVAMKRLFRMLVESSELPEIVWGIKTEGNANTAEEQMAVLTKAVNNKRNQKNDAYRNLYEGILRLQGIIDNADYNSDLQISWDELDSLSELTKAQVFKEFATGLSSLINVAGITKEQLYNIWKTNYPKSTDKDFNEFIIGLSNMGIHAAWTRSALEDQERNRGLDETEE